MTVKELIEYLQTQNPDTLVVTGSSILELYPPAKYPTPLNVHPDENTPHAEPCRGGDKLCAICIVGEQSVRAIWL
jgi:hypothetical protein